MAWRAARTLLLIAACLQLVGWAAACTQIIMGGNSSAFAYPSEVLSVRDMGFPITSINLRWEFISIPRNFKLLASPLTPTTAISFPNLTKYGSVCIGTSTTAIAAAYAKATGQPLYALTYGGFCSDGMNEAGLSAALLWDQTNAGYGRYLPHSNTTASGKESIVYFDLTTRVLSDCDTIACAKKLVSSLHIVDTDMTKAIAQEVTGYDYLPVHPTFCDKTGQCFALEWVGSDNPVIHDLPRGVLTNEPQIPEQERLYYAYKNMSQIMYDPLKTNTSWLINWPGGTAGYDMSTSGYVEPSTRYIRMSMLMDLYGPVPYAVPASRISPSHYGTQIAAFLQINNIINNAADIGSAPGSPSPLPDMYEWPDQISHYISTRDHVRAYYYVRTAWNNNQHRINVKKQATGDTLRRNYLDVVIPAAEYAKTIRF